MGETPDVSVIVAAYNTEDFIEKAIRSALVQDGVSVEVVVVDDCSTDGTREVVRAFDNDRVRLLCNESNQGPSYSRNRALEAARGTWISILDSDDWFAEGRLRRLLDAANRTGASIVADDILVFDDSKDVVATTHFDQMGVAVQSPFTANAEEFVRTNRPGLPCMRLGVMKPIISRRLFNETNVRYNPDVRFAEDFQLYVRLLVHGARMLVVPEAGYFRRRREGSISAGDKVDLLNHDVAMSRRFLAHPDLADAPAVRQALRDRLSLVQEHLAFRQFRQRLQDPGFNLLEFRLVEWVRILRFAVRRVYHKVVTHA